MAKQSDVTLTVEGFDGVMPTGVTITSQVGSIPTAIVDLAPGGTTVTQIKGVTSSLLSNTDAVKRQQDITIDISVNTYVNSEVGRKLKKLKFVGLFDGLTVGNVVGNNTYQAVVKNKAQVLLEVAIMAPGLHPASINIYKNPSWSSTIDPHGKEGKVIAWGGSIKNPEIFDNPPIKFYKKLLTHIVELQQGDWQSYTQLDKLTDGKIALLQFNYMC